MKTMDSNWRSKYLWPSVLACAAGSNFTAYLFTKDIIGLILAGICVATTFWIVSINIEDDKNDKI